MCIHNLEYSTCGLLSKAGLMLLPSGEGRCQSNRDTNKQDQINMNIAMDKYTNIRMNCIQGDPKNRSHKDF